MGMASMGVLRLGVSHRTWADSWREYGGSKGPSTSIARAAKESVHLGDAQKSTVAVPSTTTEIPAPGSDESKSQGIDIERLADQHEPVNPTPVTSKGETNFEECKKIIAATENQLHLHAARARPNARLRVAFGINSCFTSEDVNFCKNVRKGVEDKLYVPEADWEGIAKAARELAEREFAGSERKLKLFDAVQMVTMKMMLRILFARDPEDASLDNHIRKLAKEVNDQWDRSKAGLTLGETPSWSFDQQDALKDAADAIFGAWDSSDVDNPFNYILPGYETMWRAVLRGVVEMTSGRHEDGSVAWKAALSAFLDSPTRHQLQRVEIAKGLKVEHISLEILRLYPPTRRISRMHMNPDGSSRVIAADIEGMHHTADTWQPDPLVFRPERWILLDGMDTRDFLPFGNSPFNCPARRHKNDFPDVPFGVSMVAALTGSMVEAMGEKWYLRPGDFPPSEMQLHNNREDYSEVFVYRIEEETGEVAVKTDQNLGVKELQTNGTMPVVPDASASGREAGIDSEKVPEEGNAVGCDCRGRRCRGR